MQIIFKISALLLLGACFEGGKEKSLEPMKIVYDPSIPTTIESINNNELGENELNIIYSYNILGETEDCGCSMSPQGGLLPRKAFLAKLKNRKNTLLIDAGNFYFQKEKDSTEEQSLIEKEKSKKIVDFYNEEKFDLVHLSKKDQKAPTSAIKSSTISSYTLNNEKTLPFKNKNILFLSLSKNSDLNKVTDRLKKRKGKKQTLAILLSDMTFEKLYNFSEKDLKNFDSLILGGNPLMRIKKAVQAGKSHLLVSSGHKQEFTLIRGVFKNNSFHFNNRVFKLFKNSL